MDLPLRLYQIRTVGLRVTAAKAVRSLKRRVREWSGFRPDADRFTFLPEHFPVPTILQPALRAPRPDALAPSAEELRDVADHSSRTELWLPGTGWTSHAHGAPCPGMGGHVMNEVLPFEIDAEGEWMQRLINPANVREARRRWSLIRPPYIPLDWQRDHRSGTSWSEGLPAGMLRITPRPGADPKNPWDVARMHHALQVALAHGIESDTARRDALAEDFRSRVLDFLSTNPPGYGINWTVAMEVAIRMANMLLAFHVFRLHGRTFDDAFTDVLARGMAEHAEWVLEHHEWSEGMRGNHFLSNLAGLSVCAAFLGPCDLRDRIDVFVTRHLDAELLYQFHPDGSHFEASLAYHFFSAEMLAWSYACRYLRDPGHVPAPEVHTRLRAVHAFSKAMCGSGGIVPQIGDNDTGRFLPLLPFHATAHDAARPLRRPDVVALTGLVADPTVSGLQDVLDTLLRSWSTLSARPDAAGPVMIRADDFGIAVCRTSRCEWYLRAGSVGQYGRGGHAHNDQLSFVFLVDGREILTDPGTYTYTAVPTERNRFRSTSSHNTLVVDGAEQHGLPRDLREGLFWICSDKAKGRMVRAENGTWIGRHTGYGAPHTRTMEFGDHDFRIIDECECAEPKRIVFHCHPDVRVERASDHVLVCHRDGIEVRIESSGGVIACESSSYSPEYGVLVPTTRIVIPMDHSRHEVRFTVAER